VKVNMPNTKTMRTGVARNFKLFSFAAVVLLPSLHVNAATLITPTAPTLTNGGFDSNLSGWSAFGDVVVATNPFGVNTGGSNQAVMTTASAFDLDDFPFTTPVLNLSGNSPLSVGALNGLDSQLGVPAATLDPDPLNFVSAYEGSAIQQSFHMNAGDKLSFRWNFATADTLPGDYAFALINGQKFVLADTSSLTGSILGLSAPLIGTSGQNTFNFTVATSGLYKVAVGVVDVNDFTASSVLAVDQFSVQPVPEPAEYALMFAGLTLVGWKVRKTDKKSR
jgi:hypothetical protein